VLTDRAQLLAATAAVAGSDAAVAAARRALGDEHVAQLLPYLQDAAFGRALGQALTAAELDADDLRAAAADAVGAEAPELARLRRVSWASAIESALLVLAAAAILTGLSGIDFAQVREDVSGANWALVALGALLAQTPRLFQAVSTQAAVPARLAFGPVYAMQLAIGFMNVALPSSLARMAVNIRFFQRQGVTPAAAVTAGAIDSFAGNALQVVLLGLLLLFGNSSLDLQLDHSLPSGAARVLVALLLGAVAAVAAVAVVPRLRRAVLGRVRRWWPEVRTALATLRRSNRLARLVLANLAVELLFAAALGLFARSLGYEVAFGDLLLINISVSLFASLIPVPGGIGVVEGGLMVGLTAAGLPESSAFAVAILYRLATFYLPPLWGWFALRWLQRHRYL
jgi:uncharacterized protein (TIRG00374 family)